MSSYLENYILTKRYLQPGESTWEDVAERVSKVYPEIRDYLLNKNFIPGGRTLATLGTKHNLIPNCVVVDIEDDLTDIFNVLCRLMELTRRGSGIGMNFGKLRPAGTSANKYEAKSCGPVGFLNMYSIALKTVQQQARHGAFIGILPITHPDVLAFIKVKQDLTKINNFNLSVLVDNDFIEKLTKTPDEVVKTSFTIHHDDGTTEEITTINHVTYNKDFVVEDVTPAMITYRELFSEIVNYAWRSGEPGLLFKDNINRTNDLRKYLGDIDSCNPCGEISMYPNECCNLGSLNLSTYAKEIDFNPLEGISRVYADPKTAKDINEINYNPAFDVSTFVNKYYDIEGLKGCVKHATIFLNMMIDLIKTEDPPIDKFVRATRRLGLGVMGLHDMLIKMKLPYDSHEGRSVVHYVLGIVRDVAYNTSCKLVDECGSIAERLLKDGYTGPSILSDDKLTKRANIALMTIAPNGSTSMIANVSSGIEPYFSLGYYRMFSEDNSKSELVISKSIDDWIKKHIPEQDQDYVTRTIITKGIRSIGDDVIPLYIKDVFRTAQDIKPIDHIYMLATCQDIVDNAISKTINLPENASKSDIGDCILMSHRLKIKGMTVYRDNCRQNVIINSLSDDNCKDGKCDL